MRAGSAGGCGRGGQAAPGAGPAPYDGSEMTDPRGSSYRSRNSGDPGLFGYEGKVTLDGTPLSELPDIRRQSPEIERYLLPFQRVIYVRDLCSDLEPCPQLSAHPSSSKALLDLMGVARLSDIGKQGPGLAALPLPGRRNVADLTLLEALFGRDALYMGLNLYDCFPQLLKTTLYKLAELQGVVYNSAKEEEPGRIIHWAPDPHGSLAKHISAVNHWEWPHYGAIDSTPLFIRGVLRVLRDEPSFLEAEYLGLDGQVHTIDHALHAASTWLDGRLRSNREGLLEFKMSQPRGIWNQAWKDTPESYMHADGSYANHRRGIASIEVQALAYDTLLDLANYYKERSGGEQFARQDENVSLKTDSIMTLARNLKDTILDRFWLEDERGGYFALATDRDQLGNLRALAVRTSNMGHALHLLDGADPELERRRASLIKTLFSAEMLDRNGIRTLSSEEIRFVPFSYHCGSVWPWDNHVIAGELRRSGYFGLAHNLELRTWNIIDALGFFTEFVPGDNSSSPTALTITRVVDVYDGERDHWSNSYRIEKPAQETQAWTVEAIRAIKRGNQPLNPARSLSTAAIDPAKRQFELSLLNDLESPSVR